MTISETEINNNESLKNSFEYIKKLKEKYINDNTQQILNKILNSVEYRIDSILEVNGELLECVKTNKIIETYKKNIWIEYPHVKFIDYGGKYVEMYKFFSELRQLIDEMHMLTLQIDKIIMSVFMLRRFIDNNEIKSSIVYFEEYESYILIHTLVKYFNFKITHCSNINAPYNLKFAHENIKNTTIDNMELEETNIFSKEFRSNQCANMTNFPFGFN